VLKFVISTEAWIEVAPIPQALDTFDTCVLGSDIYVVGVIEYEGDNTPTATMHRYSTMANVWTKMGHSVCVLYGLIYALGGHGTTQSSDTFSSAHKYAPAANAWSTVAPMSTPRAGLSPFVLGGRRYAAGGASGLELLSSVERYDAISDSWETVPGVGLSEPREDFGVQVMTQELGLFDSLETKARRARS
jgi:N-acetylneuraminic acid mutarotase